MDTGIFDDLGDTLISRIDESHILEILNPSLTWPQLLQHPKFIGSLIKITLISSSDTELTCKAIVKEIGYSIDKQLVLILHNIKLGHEKPYLETWKISYDKI